MLMKLKTDVFVKKKILIIIMDIINEILDFIDIENNCFSIYL